MFNSSKKIAARNAPDGEGRIRPEDVLPEHRNKSSGGPRMGGLMLTLRPLIFLVGAFVALAIASVTVVALADSEEAVWSATLSVKDMNTTLGCNDNVDGASCRDALSDNTFELGGVVYTITQLRSNAGTIGPFFLYLDKRVPDALKQLTLLTGDHRLAISDAAFALNVVVWTGTSLGWSAGQTVGVSLDGLRDATLRSLSMTAEEGPAVTLSPVFSSTTETYTATVERSIRYVRVVGVTNNAVATFTVNGETPTPNDQPPAVYLEAGKNTIEVVVTAADDETTKTYTMRVFRQSGVTVSAESLSLQEHDDLPSPESSGTYTIVLDSEPSSMVRIHVISSDPSRIRDSGIHVFEGEDWNVPRTVRVSARFDYDAVDDTVTLSHVIYTLAPEYQDLMVDPVTVTVRDVDTAAVVVSENALNLKVGQTTRYSVRLDAAPAGSNEVTVTAASSADTKVPVSPDSLTFTADDWEHWQDFTVTGVAGGDAVISHTVSGNDPTYNGGVIVESVAVTVEALQGRSIQQPEEGATAASPQAVEPRPGPVQNLRLSDAAGRVTVTWQAPENGGAPNRYIVHLKPEDGGKGKTKRPKAGKLSVTFKNLEPGATYQVWVRAKNEGGKGERTYATITLP